MKYYYLGLLLPIIFFLLGYVQERLIAASVMRMLG